MQPGITFRVLVNAIPYMAIQKGLLTVAKEGKKNVYNGRILDIEGLPDLKVEQAFELSDASAELSAGDCTVRLNKEPIIEFLTPNITLLKWMLAMDYGDQRTIQRRIDAMQAWLDNPALMKADPDAEYAEIDLNEIKEPLVACPNDPDDIKPLSEVADTKIDEVFIGSCMTNIGHYRAAGKVLEELSGSVPTRLWIAPPAKMDQHQLTEEGYYSIFGKVGARTEMPGCSLCMGNQARVADGATVMSTSTRNFPNLLAKMPMSICVLWNSRQSRRPWARSEEYMDAVKHLEPMAGDIYRYLNFNEMEDYQSIADIVLLVALSS